MMDIGAPYCRCLVVPVGAWERPKTRSCGPLALDTAGNSVKRRISATAQVLSTRRGVPSACGRLLAAARLFRVSDASSAQLITKRHESLSLVTYARRTRAPPRESGAGLRDSVDAIVVCHESEITSKLVSEKRGVVSACHFVGAHAACAELGQALSRAHRFSLGSGAALVGSGRASARDGLRQKEGSKA